MVLLSITFGTLLLIQTTIAKLKKKKKKPPLNPEYMLANRIFFLKKYPFIKCTSATKDMFRKLPCQLVRIERKTAIYRLTRQSKDDV
jgi:hypothetical protein